MLARFVCFLFLSSVFLAKGENFITTSRDVLVAGSTSNRSAFGGCGTRRCGVTILGIRIPFAQIFAYQKGWVEAEGSKV